MAVLRDHHHEAALETLTEEPLKEQPLPHTPPGLMGKPRPPQENRQSATVRSEHSDNKTNRQSG